MTALTPGCDPDMSTTGAPFGSVHEGVRVRSGLVLATVVLVSALLLSGGAVPVPAAVLAVLIGGPCAVALIARGARLAHQVGTNAAATTARALHRSRPVPSATH